MFVRTKNILKYNFSYTFIVHLLLSWICPQISSSHLIEFLVRFCLLLRKKCFYIKSDLFLCHREAKKVIFLVVGPLGGKILFLWLSLPFSSPVCVYMSFFVFFQIYCAVRLQLSNAPKKTFNSKITNDYNQEDTL